MVSLSAETEARLQGWADALRGHTANPYGDLSVAHAWRQGYDEAVSQGLAVFPRFGSLKRRRHEQT